MVDWISQIASLLLTAVIGAIFIWIGAKLAKISNATFLKAFEAALIGAILALILNYFWTYGGNIVAFILVIPVIKFVYDTSWGKAFVAWLIYFIVLFILVVVIIGAAFLAVFG